MSHIFAFRGANPSVHYARLKFIEALEALSESERLSIAGFLCAEFEREELGMYVSGKGDYEAELERRFKFVLDTIKTTHVGEAVLFSIFVKLIFARMDAEMGRQFWDLLDQSACRFFSFIESIDAGQQYLDSLECHESSVPMIEGLPPNEGNYDMDIYKKRLYFNIPKDAVKRSPEVVAPTKQTLIQRLRVCLKAVFKRR